MYSLLHLFAGIKYVEQVWGSAVHHYFQQQHLDKGTELFSMGSPSEHLYFVRSGEFIRLQIEIAQERVGEITHKREGEITHKRVGEIAHKRVGEIALTRVW
jgi:hypothetical protein